MTYHVSFETKDGYAVSITKESTVIVSNEVDLVQQTGEFGFYLFPEGLAETDKVAIENRVREIITKTKKFLENV